jgi:predicted RNA polymerase sigma factor
MEGLEAVWRAESGKILATLIRLARGFEDAEEVLEEAFLSALEV